MPTPIGWPVKPLVFAITIVVGVAVEDRAQCVDLGRGAAAAGRGVGLVGDEHHVRGHVVAVVAARLGLPHHVFHDPGDVVHVEPGAVEGAVGGDRAQHLADRLHATLAGRVGGLDDDARPRPCP